MTCPACGTENPAAARFCNSCGHALAAPSEERRVVTVLFADLVGFTALSEQLDPEQVKHLVDAAFERLVRDVVAFGGRIDKILGDGILALFGAPTAHEDDAERAVRAALRMQLTLAAYGAETGVEIRMRIGVNTGEVLVGALRAGGDYTAMGDVVNSASRLQTQAEPGEILVGEATHEATSGVISYESRGTIVARGREQPVRAWRPLETLVPPGYRHRQPRIPLVGRERELELVLGAVDLSVSNRRAQQVLLLGEAGIGKTRLADEVATEVAARHGLRVFTGRCVPYGESNVFWPIAEILRQASRVDADEPLEIAREKVHQTIERLRRADVAGTELPADKVDGVTTGLLHLMGYDGPPGTYDLQRARVEAVDSLVTFTRAYTHFYPLLVRLADLHWADDLVLGLLDELSGRLAKAPFVVIATARRTVLRRWSPRAGRFNALTLNLQPLDRDAGRELLSQLFMGAGPEPEVADMLLDRAGGNPLYLEELARLVGSSPAGATGQTPELELPDTLRGLVASRIDALTQAEREVMEDASVWGLRGTVGALHRMAEEIRGVAGDTAATVRSLGEKELLSCEGNDWSFQSDIVRDVTYSRLTKTDRIARHAGIGEYLERVFAGRVLDDALVETIAHHYAEAAAFSQQLSPDDEDRPAKTRALEWLTRSARRAEQAAAWQRAERAYATAIGLCDPEELSVRLPLELGRARVMLEQWDIPRALAVAKSLRRATDRKGDPLRRAEVTVLEAEVELRTGQFERARRKLRSALRDFEHHEDRAGQARIQRLLGTSSLFQGDADEAEEPTNEALAAYREIEDRTGEAWALQNLAWIAFLRGSVVEATSSLSVSRQAFMDIGDRTGILWCDGMSAFVEFHQGRLDAAEALAWTVLTDAEERGDRWPQGMMLNVLASIALWRGRMVECMELAGEAVTHFEPLGHPLGASHALALLGRAELMHGEVREGFEHLRQSTRTGAPATRGLAELTQTLALVQVGDAPAPDFERIDHLFGHQAEVGQPDALAALLFSALQHLRLDELGLLLPDVLEAASNTPGLGAAIALADAVVGNPVEAMEVADGVRASSAHTFLDAAWSHLATAIAGMRRGDSATGREHLMAAVTVVDTTEDRLDQAIMRLAAAELAGAARWTEGTEVVGVDAEARLSTLGVDAKGWRKLFRAAATRIEEDLHLVER